MVALATVDVYGAPSYGGIGMAPEGIIFHTPEWGTVPTLQNAIDCALWQATPSNFPPLGSGGSYHVIIGHGGQFNDPIASCITPDHWVAARSVPWNLASGGLTSNHTPPPAGVWAPNRYPWIQSTLSALAFADPNRWMHQIALAGAASWFEQNGYPRGLLIRLAQWVITLEDAYGYDALLTLHRQWQSNRADPGPETLPDQILVEYFAIKDSSAPVVPPPVIVGPFPDVPATHWAAGPVAWAKARGITTGKADGTFGPDDKASRAEVVTFLYRALGEE